MMEYNNAKLGAKYNNLKLMGNSDENRIYK